MNLFTIPNLTKNRVFGLDLLRFFAIFFVVYGHAGHFLPFRDKVDLYMKIYYDGVGIFFVLSGFLIGTIIIKQLLKDNVKKSELFHFWKQRWSRTLPNYYFFLILNIFFEFIFNRNNSFDYYFPFLVFLQSIIYDKWTFFYNSWSLCVEEWFYLLIPLFLFVLLKLKIFKPKIIFLITCIVVILLVNLLRVYIYINNIDGNLKIIEEMKFSIFTRFDALMYGMLAAYIKFYYLNVWNKFKNIGFIIGILGLLIYYFLPVRSSFYIHLISYTLTSLTIFSFLPYLVTLKVKETKITRIITHISLISYSMYLVNSFFVMIISYLPIWDNVDIFISTLLNRESSWGIIMSILYLSFWVVTILLSTLIYKYFEIPTTKYLRNRK